MDEIELKKSENTVRHDKFDEMTFKDISENAETLKQTIDSNQERLATVKKLAEDCFNSLYKYNPETLPDEQIADSHLHNKNLVNKGMESAEWQRLRSFTKLQEMESAIGTQAIVEQLMKEIPADDLKKMNEQATQAEQLEQDIQKMIDQIQGLEQLQGQGDAKQQKDIAKQINEVQNKLQPAQQKQQALGQQIQQASNGMSQQVRRAMRAALNKAEEEVKGYHEFCTGWGVEQGQLQKLPAQQKIELAQKLKSGKLREIAQLIGRMKRLAMAKQQQKIKREPDEVVDVCRGKDIGNVLPSEMVSLADPELEMLFLNKYQNGELLQYELEGKEKLAKGAIVICVDNSGSMMGDPEIWSKAVAVGLLEIATKEKRRFACVHFGGPSDPLDVTVIEPTDGIQDRLKKLIHIAEYFEGGGTDFEKPIDEAVRIIEAQPSFKKADIVFVTDGECGVSDDWLKKFRDYKKQKQVKVFSINIGYQAETLERFSEQVVTLAELTKVEDKVAGKVFEFI